MGKEQKKIMTAAVLIVAAVLIGSVYFARGGAADDVATSDVRSQVQQTQNPGALAGNVPADAPEDGIVTSFEHPTEGKILTDGRGMTLYIFTKDTAGESVCYDQCAVNWPPLFATGRLKGSGVDDAKLGTTTRKDGAKQLTYEGKPLYYYFQDKAPGDTTGEGVGGVWFMIRNPK